MALCNLDFAMAQRLADSFLEAISPAENLLLREQRGWTQVGVARQKHCIVLIESKDR
jgi:hypothetical protein